MDVMVMDFDNIGRNELIGRIMLAGWIVLNILVTVLSLFCDFRQDWIRSHGNQTLAGYDYETSTDDRTMASA